MSLSLNPTRLFWRSLSACLWLTATAASAQVQPPPAEDFARWPQMSSFTVSPSNRHAAFLMRGPDGYLVAAVVDLENPGSVRVVADYEKANIARVFWVNDRRLVYEAYESGARVVDPRAGTFAVDRDGDNRRNLLGWGWQAWRSWDNKGDEVLAFSDPPEGLGAHGNRRLVRLNTNTGSTSDLSFHLPSRARGWTFDAQGELRLVSTRADGRERLHLRGSGKSDWTEIENHPELSDQVLTPLYIEGDGTLIVLSRRGRDTAALYTYDPQRRALSAEPLAAAREFDVGGEIETDQQARQVVGVHLQADRLRSVWFDERLQAAQQAVDAALPAGRFNLLLCGNCLSAKRLVVRSSSDRISAEYHVYDVERRSLTRLGQQRPWLTEASQGQRTFHRVTARDGLSLPVVVTHPPQRQDERALPAVLLVHGGPWVRGTNLAWSAEPQFLASRGYRVLEVDFRGSTGLGSKHFRAGWKQWGLAMQDDLADVVAWAVREGQIDGARVCIVGASYGGYAALMGPVRHPGTYRCAASHAGVTDLTLMFGGDTTDLAEPSRRFTLPVLIGDPKTDAAMLRQHSPLHRVADMRVPVLLTQGRLDRRVTPVHADRFEAAARAAGVDIERVNYAEEAHSWFEPANHADYLRRLEKHLARHLQKEPAAAPKAVP